jgi:glycosyltransferase involved in cell wall biosynthesis
MRVLHAYNAHRGLGGATLAAQATIRILRERGVQVEEFTRDSRSLPSGIAGKVTAFAAGLYAAGAVREFEAVLRQRRPDIVHVHELYPLISPWILPASARAGVPVVMTCNDFRLSCPIATHYSRGSECYRCLGGREYWCAVRNCRSSVPESIAFALRNASARLFGLYERHVWRFVSISEFHREYLVGRVGIAADRIALNYPPITLPAEPVADPSQGAYVGFAGRFAPEKGVEVMIEACRRLGVPMRFAGDASHHPAVRPGDQASFVMTQSREELAEFYRGARVIVSPSIWTETFGVVPAEAMSHGIPVVASSLGALKDTVPDGEAGLHARPGDAADFAEKIGRIWNDADLARRLGRGARRHAASQFSEQAHFDRILRVYGQAGGRTAGP